MENKTVTLPSGATLVIQLAEFSKAHRLLKAFAKEVEQIKLTAGVANSSAADMMAMKKMGPETLEIIKNLVARVIYSEAIEAALWPCMETVLWNNQHVKRETFERPDARQDFLVVIQEVLMANLSPFGTGLGSKLKTLLSEEQPKSRE
jgi:hypothetical protein